MKQHVDDRVGVEDHRCGLLHLGLRWVSRWGALPALVGKGTNFVASRARLSLVWARTSPSPYIVKRVGSECCPARRVECCADMYTVVARAEYLRRGHRLRWPADLSAAGS